MTMNTMDKAAISALLDKKVRHRQVNRVLHGHPGTALWKERNIDVSAILTQRADTRKRGPRRFHVYVATPYCLPTEPDRCGFCLFPSEEYRGGRQLEEYLGYLRREGAMYRPFLENDVPDSVYFGGGTANLYKPQQYVELMGLVREVFPRFSPLADVTLEGIPQTYTREKLAVMKECGINRISVGVQQFDDDLIALSGRKQKREHVLRVLEWCRELGLRTSIDLIFGWPRQTVSRMLRDLETAVSQGVCHLTHYELNVGGRTDFARNHSDTLPSIGETLEMFRAARDYLSSCGFRQVSTYDWEKPDGELGYEDALRQPLRADIEDEPCGIDVWGWGFAGISRFGLHPQDPGWTYMNSESVQANFSAIDEGRFPVARGYRYTHEDVELTMLYQAIVGMDIGRRRYRDLFGCDVYEKYRPLWDALVDRGWLEVVPDALRLTGDGMFFTPTVQEILSLPRVQALQRELVAGRRRALPTVS